MATGVDADGVERTADDVVTDTGEIFHAATADKDDRVFWVPRDLRQECSS